VSLGRAKVTNSARLFTLGEKHMGKALWEKKSKRTVNHSFSIEYLTNKFHEGEVNIGE
jgi:hypothetical protein